MFKFKKSQFDQQSSIEKSKHNTKSFQGLSNVTKSARSREPVKISKAKKAATRHNSLDSKCFLANTAKLAENNRIKLSLNNERQDNVSARANNNLELKLGDLKNELNKLKDNLSLINNGKEIKKLVKTAKTIKKSKTKDLNMRKSLISSQPIVKPIQVKSLSIKSSNLNSGKRTASAHDVLRVERELQMSREKCKALESIVEEKNKRIESYSNALREISENINCLINNLENLDLIKETSDNNQKSHLTKEKLDLKHEETSMNNLKECLNQFKNKLGNYSFGERQERNLIDSDPINKESAQKCDQQTIPIDLKDVVKDGSSLPITTNLSGVVTSTTSSDTLIDADFSFQSIHLNPYKPLNTKMTSHELHKKEACFLSRNLINLDYGQGDDEDGEENERININLDELSITTIETLNSSSSLALSSSSMNSNMSTYNNLEDNLTFENGLQELDQKIDKVKQLIESMRSN